MNEVKGSLQAEAINESINQYLYQTSSLYHQLARTFGLSPTELVAYYFLDDRKPRALSELSRMCGLSRQTMHSCLKKLEAQNLVQSLIPAEAKRPLYTLTESGYRAVHPLIERIRQAEYEAIDQLSPQERTILPAALAHHTQKLEQAFSTLETGDFLDQAGYLPKKE